MLTWDVLYRGRGLRGRRGSMSDLNPEESVAMPDCSPIGYSNNTYKYTVLPYSSQSMPRMSRHHSRVVHQTPASSASSSSPFQMSKTNSSTCMVTPRGFEHARRATYVTTCAQLSMVASSLSHQSRLRALPTLRAHCTQL